MSNVPHVADAEAQFRVINVTPDFCIVGTAVVAFDPIQILQPEKLDYAKTVFSRSEKVLIKGSVVKGVLGNAGKGIASGVSLANGHVKVLEGSATVFIEDKAAARHDDLCEMNGAC
jgi:Domain of unknown function (DUF4150)